MIIQIQIGTRSTFGSASDSGSDAEVKWFRIPNRTRTPFHIPTQIAFGIGIQNVVTLGFAFQGGVAPSSGRNRRPAPTYLQCGRHTLLDILCMSLSPCHVCTLSCIDSAQVAPSTMTAGRPVQSTGGLSVARLKLVHPPWKGKPPATSPT